VKLKDENKLDLIYDATLKLVAKEGLAGLTMSRIAKEAGIGTGTLYVYFKGKEELINALFLKIKCRSAQCSLRGYDEAEPFKVGFRKIWMNIFHDRLEGHQHAVFSDQCHFSPYLDAATREAMDRIAAPFFSLMERGKREHLVKEVDTVLLLTAIMGVIAETVLLFQSGQMKATPENIEAAFQVCWDGIKQ